VAKAVRGVAVKEVAGEAVVISPDLARLATASAQAAVIKNRMWRDSVV
jgi:hypothetical protein